MSDAKKAPRTKGGARMFNKEKALPK